MSLQSSSRRQRPHQRLHGPVRLVALIVMALIGLAATGCQFNRPPLVDQPRDMFPAQQAGYDQSHNEKEANLRERINALADTTYEMKRKLSELESTLAARNAELIETRLEHKKSLEQMTTLSEEVEKWNASLEEIQTALANQEKKRIEMLDTLNEKLNRIGSAALLR